MFGPRRVNVGLENVFEFVPIVVGGSTVYVNAINYFRELYFGSQATRSFIRAKHSDPSAMYATVQKFSGAREIQTNILSVL